MLEKNKNNFNLIENMLDYLDPLIKSNPYARSCGSISDKDFVKFGLLRILSGKQSGKGFLEKLAFKKIADINRTHYFSTLRSERRLDFMKELINSFLLSNSTTLDNSKCLISKFCPELDEFDIEAGDGHHHNAPVHETRIDGTIYTTQHFYALNLRSRFSREVAVAIYGDTRKKEHDMHMLKRQRLENLLFKNPKFKKKLIIWDRAGIDYELWRKLKFSSGIYFLSMEKENTKYENLEDLEYDKEDARNNGVVSNEISYSKKKNFIRKVTYICPEKGKQLVFITNLPKDIPPGVIAYLYKCRWNIEKMYNTFKHKLYEQKAWATTECAKRNQAQMICLAYNLSLVMNDEIENKVPDGDKVHEAHYRRKEKRIKKMREKAKKFNRRVSSLLLHTTSLIELPIMFYRWISENLYSFTSIKEAITLYIERCKEEYV